jgi:Tol biopolymer transport system component
MSESRLGDEERRVAIDLFEREALILAQLDHLGLTRIWDYFQADGHAFLVMEYVPGLTLRELLRQIGGPLPERFVVACAIQLCTVLAYLHARRPPVIFRDLKPANVMVVAPPGAAPADLLALPPDELVCKLIDFGIARIFKPEQPGDTLIIGTPGYAPPEQYGQGQTDARSDIYGLGATMHHLLSGQAPAGMPLPPLDQVAPAVSPGLARVVARATALDPADRYPNAQALRGDLLALARADSYPPGADQRDRYARPAAAPEARPAPRITVPLAPTVGPARPRPAARGPLLLLIAGVLLAVTLGALALGTLNPPSSRPAPTPVAARPTAAPAGEWLLPGAPGRLAYGQLNSSGGYDLLVATLDGAPPRPLIAGGNDTAPAWSPDGRRLAISHAVGGARGIYVGPPDSPAAQLVSPAGTEARYAAWSPDGRRLAFTALNNGVWQLAIVDLARQEISFPGPQRLGWIAWGRGALLYAARPDSDGPQDIFTVDVSGASANLTNTPDAEEDFPDRSTDGRRIVFVSSPPGSPSLSQRQIYIMNADGSGRAQLTQAPGPHTNPVWSPDGKWIAYLSKAAGGDWQVWAMHADGSAPRQLTFGPQQKFYLAWGK